MRKARMIVLALSVVLMFSVSAWGDVAVNATNFPDEVFREYVSSSIDTNHDGILSDEDISATKNIIVGNNVITTLKGVEHFTALTRLDCYNNDLTELDVSNNTALTSLNCYNNDLTELDVSKNTALMELDCYNNQLTALDVSHNTALTSLNCSSNDLTELDVSNNTALTDLWCYSNQLTALDVSNNTALTDLQCSNNQLTALDVSKPNLTYYSASNQTRTVSIDVTGNTSYPYSVNLAGLNASLDISKVSVSSVVDSNSSGVTYDLDSTAGVVYFASAPSTLAYNYATGYRNAVMDVTLTLSSSGSDSGGTSSGLAVSESTFPDSTFRSYITENFDTNNDGYLSDSEIASVTTLYLREQGITDLTGIENFTALTHLDCYSNDLTGTLDLSALTELVYLDVSRNGLTSLDVSGCVKLETLDCANNQLTTLNITNNTALTKLYCYINRLTSLDVSNNPALEYLNCAGNQLSSLEMGEKTALMTLDCAYNQLTALDVRNSPALTKLDCFANQLMSLDVSNNTALTDLECGHNQLTELDLRNQTSLVQLDLGNSSRSTLYAGSTLLLGSSGYPNNQIAEIDVSRNLDLSQLDCSGNLLTELDVSNNTALTDLLCYSNDLAELDVSRNTALMDLSCSRTQLTTLDLSSNTALQYLYCEDNNLAELDIRSNTALISVRCVNNQLTELDCSNNVALEEIWCYGNLLSRLDISGCNALTYLTCGDNNLAALDVSNNTALTSLYCNYQSLEVSPDVTGDTTYPYSLNLAGLNASLDISKVKGIDVYASSYSRSIESNLDLSTGVIYFASAPSTMIYNYDTGYTGSGGSMNVTLTFSDVSGASGVAINATNFPDEVFREYVSSNFDTDSDGVLSDSEIASVTEIHVYNMGITTLEGIEHFTALTDLECSNNQLTALDVSNNTALTDLSCGGNQLTTLDVSNNTALTWLYCYSNQLTALDVSNNTALTYLSCGGNQLTALDVSNNTALTYLYCYDNDLTALDVSHNTALTKLQCLYNQLTALDVSSNTALTDLLCYNNQLTTLDVSSNTALMDLRCDNNQLTALDVSNNTALTWLYCYSNQLTALDLSKNVSLNTVVCSSQDREVSTDLTNNTYTLNLAELDPSFVPTRVTSTSSNVGYDYDSSTGVVSFSAAPSSLTYTYDTGYTGSGGSMEVTISLSNPTNSGGDSTSGLAVSESTFPDSAFRSYVQGFDTNNDGYLSDSELASVTSLNLQELGITDLTGIEKLTALTHLNCFNNQLTGMLDLSANTALIYLDCESNDLTALDVSTCTALEHLNCAHNLLTELDLTNNLALTNLYCENNHLAALNVEQTSLSEMMCASQDLTVTSLDLTGRSDYPYSLNMAALSASLDITRVHSIDVVDSQDLAVSCSLDVSAGIVYFAAKPQTVAYDYYTGAAASLYMGVTLTVSSDVEPSPDTPAPAMSLTLTPSSQTITEGENITPIVLTTYYASGDVTYTVDSLPSGLTLSGDTITGTIASEGNYSFTVTATDSADSVVVATGTITVNAASTPEPAPTPSGITGITITNPAAKSITLSADGGSFSATLYASGTPYGQVVWGYSASSGLSVDIPSTGSTATLSGIAPANTTTQNRTYTITITAHDSTGTNYTDTLTVIVRGTTPIPPALSDDIRSQDIPPALSDDVSSQDVNPTPGGNGGGNGGGIRGNGRNRFEYAFDIPQGVRNRLAARFAGRDIHQVSDSEIVSESWELDADDLQAISNRGEAVVLYLPEIRPANSGVYLLMLTLEDVSTGASLNLYGISGSSSIVSSDEASEASISALEDADYVLLDENGNEITQLPADGVIYAALNLTEGTTTRGVVTTVSELKTGTIQPVSQEDLSDTVIEKIAETMNISEDKIKFVTEEHISEPQEPTQAIRQTISARNEEIIGKLNTITVSEDGYYVFKVTLSDDLYEQIKGVSVNDLRVYALYDDGKDKAETSRVRASFITGLLNTWELLTLSGEKLEFGAKEFLMVGLLNAGTPFSVYLTKILMMLLMGGCDPGLGLAGLAALGLGAIYFTLRRKH